MNQRHVDREMLALSLQTPDRRRFLRGCVSAATGGTLAATLGRVYATPSIEAVHTCAGLSPSSPLTTSATPDDAPRGSTFTIGAAAPGAIAAQAVIYVGQDIVSSLNLPRIGAGNFQGSTMLDRFGTHLVATTAIHATGWSPACKAAFDVGRSQTAGELSLAAPYVTYSPGTGISRATEPPGTLPADLDAAITAGINEMNAHLANGLLAVEMRDPFTSTVIPQGMWALHEFALVSTPAGCPSFGCAVNPPGGEHIDVEFGWTGLYISFNQAAVATIVRLLRDGGGLAAVAALFGVTIAIAALLLGAAAILDLQSFFSKQIGGDGGVTACWLGYGLVFPFNAPIVTPHLP